MANFSMQHDIGSLLTVKAAFNAAEVTAGSTAEDAIEVNGKIIDRQSTAAFGDKWPLSAKLALTYDAALGATARNVSFTMNLQHSSSTASTAFSDYSDKDGNTATTGIQTRTTAGNSAPAGVLSADYDLGSAKRYIRAQFTPTLSATATDTVDYGGVLVFSGFDQYPAP